MRVLIFSIFTIFITSFSTASFCHDIDGDGKVGLAEAIDALQVVAGAKFENTQQLCTDGIDNDGDGNIDCADEECSDMTCDDGNLCTENDSCSAGTCQGALKNCSDSNVCTDDSCNPASGCFYTNNTSPCDDSDVCTTSDTCSAGACVGGVPLSCDDQDQCTADSCNPIIGCTNIIEADDTMCNSGLGSCQGGVCTISCSFPMHDCGGSCEECCTNLHCLELGGDTCIGGSCICNYPPCII